MKKDDIVLTDILNKLEEISKKQIDIEKKLGEIEEHTNRMSEHINFVDKTYDTVKIPFHYLMTKINTISNSSFLMNKNVAIDYLKK
jgi:archaellum component FlaC